MFLIGICCAWVAGIIIGSYYHLPFFLIFAGLVPIPLALILRKYRKYLILLSCCLAALFGAAFYYSNSSNTDQLSTFNNQAIVEVRGVIGSQPENRGKTIHLELSVQEIKTGQNRQNISGKLLVFVPRYPEYQYGDVLILNGKLEDPPKFDNFDYPAYLARDGIYSTMLNPQIQVVARKTGFKPLEWIYTLRERLSHVLAVALPEPQTSLAQGIVLGINSSIPDTLRTDLSVSGTAHLLAISGINLSIIAGLLVTLGLWLFGRRHYIYVWLALFVIWFYTLITGMQAPVLRSAIMASMVLFADLLGRQKNAFVALAFSAAIMVGVTPQILWSVSFQLSFISMAGLILIAPILQNLGRRAVHAKLAEDSAGAKAVILVTDSFSVTFGALVMVWPIIALDFGIVSFIGPLATFLVAPSLSFIIVLGGLTAISGLVSLPVAQVIGWSAWLFLSYMLWMVTAFANFPWAFIRINPFNVSFIWAYYVLICLAIWLKRIINDWARLISEIAVKIKASTLRSAEIFDGIPKKWIIVPLLIIAFMSIFTAATYPDNLLHVSILDVGEGDAIFIKNGNQNLLIDGGSDPRAVCLGLSDKMPYWDRSIDLVILTHPHLDHLSGLIEVLKRYKVGQVLAPNLSSQSPSYQEWLNLIKTRNIKYNFARAGQIIKLYNGATLDILNPPEMTASNIESDLENKGIVARLVLDKVSFLFTADIGQEAETRLVNQRADLLCTVLKVSHHGSSTSSSTEFLTASKPQIAVISSGANNLFGHPSEKVIGRLKDTLGSDNNIYRTDKSGTIEFSTDGRQLWVKTGK